MCIVDIIIIDTIKITIIIGDDVGIRIVNGSKIWEVQERIIGKILSIYYY